MIRIRSASSVHQAVDHRLFVIWGATRDCRVSCPFGDLSCLLRVIWNPNANLVAPSLPYNKDTIRLLYLTQSPEGSQALNANIVTKLISFDGNFFRGLVTSC